MTTPKPPTSSNSPWPEHPFPLITTVLPPSPTPHNHHPKTIHTARLMALTHNTIFRALNAVHTQAPLISPTTSTRDVTDLLTFLNFTLTFLTNHHRSEELVFFPMLEAQARQPGMMALDVAQHLGFEGELGELVGYVKGLLGEGEGVRFDADELRGRIEALAGPLGEHLREEIGRLVEVGGLVGGEVMEVCYRALHDEAEGTTDAFEIGPLVLGCQDRGLNIDGEDIQFPVLPFAWAAYAVEYFVARRYKGAWRFCPSTFHGEPRDTDFFKFEAGGGGDGGDGGKLEWYSELVWRIVGILVGLLFLWWVTKEYSRDVAEILKSIGI